MPTEDLPEEDVARIRAHDEIERALNTLSPRECNALKLQFYEGLGYAEIAR
ncbi:MAG: RNA polymerase sigma factor [Steroidobacter sp.]